MAGPRHSQQVTDDSCNSAVAVTISGTDAVLVDPCRAFYVGGAGALTVRFTRDCGASGADVTLTGLIPGTIYWMRIAIFRLAGATATGVVALY